MPIFDRAITALRQGYDRLNGSYAPAPVRSVADTRITDYDRRDMMLDGTIYNPVRRSGGGGALRHILQDLGKPCDEAKNTIVGYFHPTRAIVDCYANTLTGSFGNELVPEIDGKPVKPAVADALSRLWRWSNLDAYKTSLTELAANQGTVGIRVVTLFPDKKKPNRQPRVFLDFDHPKDIIDVESDERGNPINVLLEYEVFHSPAIGEPERAVKVREIIGKDRHSKEFEGVEQLTPEQQVNQLGVCPYVVLRHDQKHGEFFGRHAYYGSERAIHGINWGLSQLDESVWQHIFPTWMFSGAGPKPVKYTLNKLTALYIQDRQNHPSGTAEAITPQIAIAETVEYVRNNVEFLRERQPEMILTSLKLLSGISGETLAKVQQPVEAAIRKARSQYEDAIIRALQIGMSFGVLMRLWDIGTGMGTKEAADRAYDDGQGPEAFGFKDRPALPPSPYSQQEQARADVAAQKERFALASSASKLIGDRVELLKLAGYDDTEAERLAAVEPPKDEPQAGENGIPATPGRAMSPRLAAALARLQ